MAEEEREGARLLALFDSCWFGRRPAIPPQPGGAAGRRRIPSDGEEEEEEAPFPSTHLARRPQQLCSIPSGKLAPETGEITGALPEKKAEKKRKSKSMSELQFEELKGFMDLGFTFSEGASDQRLLSLVPGLQRFGQQKGEEEAEEGLVSRPYLSEAWAWTAVDDRKSLAVQRRLQNWKVPAPSDGVDMKDHLRHWVHNVASSVR